MKKIKNALTEIWFAQSAGSVRATGDMIEILGLHFLLVCFAVVEVVKVRHDDWHRQRDGKHTGDGAQRSHNLAPNTHGPNRRKHIKIMLSL